MIGMKLEEIAALFTGVLIQPVLWQIFLLLNPAARDAPPADPTTKVLGQLTIFIASTLAAMEADTPINLGFAGTGSYALIEILNEVVKVAYPPTLIATPRQ